jgi:hypothetical protein
MRQLKAKYEETLQLLQNKMIELNRNEDDQLIIWFLIHGFKIRLQAKKDYEWISGYGQGSKKSQETLITESLSSVPKQVNQMPLSIAFSCNICPVRLQSKASTDQGFKDKSSRGCHWPPQTATCSTTKVMYVYYIINAYHYDSYPETSPKKQSRFYTWHRRSFLWIGQLMKRNISHHKYIDDGWWRVQIRTELLNIPLKLCRRASLPFSHLIRDHTLRYPGSHLDSGQVP